MQQALWTGMRACALAAMGTLLLAGCSSSPKPVVPVTLHVRLTASDDINPDTSGRASPVVVRLFQLHDAASFGNADFFALYDHEKETLSADLVGSAEYVLRPGETRDIELQPDPNVKNLGFLAAFRDLPVSQWRASWQLPPPSKKPRKLPVDVELKLAHTAIAIGAPGPATGH
ncbi:MAG TPA: type VI secretion system lipoprotein TssJ [Steroidobacteraceae bacterium]|nr:type VI secretion system lipoprotein TssJ [Steroidobacteraceae bacterium]